MLKYNLLFLSFIYSISPAFTMQIDDAELHPRSRSFSLLKSCCCPWLGKNRIQPLEKVELLHLTSHAMFMEEGKKNPCFFNELPSSFQAPFKDYRIAGRQKKNMRYQKKTENMGFLEVWLIKKEGRLVGGLKLSSDASDLLRLMIWIREADQKKGIATAALKKIYSQPQSSLGFKGMRSFIKINNYPSLYAHLAAGARIEGCSGEEIILSYPPQTPYENADTTRLKAIEQQLTNPDPAIKVQGTIGYRAFASEKAKDHPTLGEYSGWRLTGR